MEIVVAASVAKKRIIGCAGKIPWAIPEDEEHFRNIVGNHPVIVGRKTFESLPDRLRDIPLSVVSKDPDFIPRGVVSTGSLIYVLHALERETSRFDTSEAIVAGGGGLFHDAIPYAQRIEITYIDQVFEGDVKFPYINRLTWSRHKEKQEGDLVFLTYLRSLDFVRRFFHRIP